MRWYAETFHVHEDILKLGTSQMMEDRLPDARELSYQHLMAGSVKQTFKASPSWSSKVPAPQLQPEALGIPSKEKAISPSTE